jgi:hypothetical protein
MEQKPDPKELAKKFVADITQKIPMQNKHDVFMLGALVRIRERMDEANRGIHEKVEALLMKSNDNKDVQDQLASVLKISVEAGAEEGLKDLQEMMASRANIDVQLQALLGVVQYSILLAARIDVFRKITEIIIDAGAETLNDDDLRVKILKYGPNLQYVWQKAFSECKSMDERQMLSKCIYGKEVKFGSDS